jgi:hypothetical protein
MKTKFNTVMVNISQNEKSPLAWNIKKKPCHTMHVIGIQVLALETHKNVAGLNQLIGSQLALLHNWMSNGNTYIKCGAQQRYFDLFQAYFAKRGCCGHDRMLVGFTTTYAISAYHH